MAEAKHTPLGSGMSVIDGAGYSTLHRPHAMPLPSRRWRGEISGVENGVVVRSWVGPECDTKAEALADARAAIAKAEGR